MAAKDYSGMAATAKRLIDRFGRSVTLRKRSTTLSSSSKPWLGNDASDTTRSASAVFVAAADLGLAVTEGRGRLHALVAASSLSSGDKLEGFERLEDGSDAWDIVRTELLAPGDTRLLYDMTLEAPR